MHLVVLAGAGLSAGVVAGPAVLASLDDEGGGDAGGDGADAGVGGDVAPGGGDPAGGEGAAAGAGTCADLSALATGTGGRDGSFSPRLGGDGSTGAGIAPGGAARLLDGGGGRLSCCPTRNAIPAPPSRASTTAPATYGMTGLRAPLASPDAVAM